MRQINYLRQAAFAASTALLVAILLDSRVSQQAVSASAHRAVANLTPFSASLSSTLPPDVDTAAVRRLDREGDVRGAQRLFDLQSWKVFLALNWPALSDGAPDNRKTLADASAPRVWAHWINISHVFKEHGTAPDPWPAPFASKRVLVVATHNKAAWRHWFAPAATENTEAFSGPLVDQNGKWVRYQVMIDQPEYEYIVRNTLYNQEGQVAYAQSGKVVDFPVNRGAHPGAIEIKLAWKELGKGDDPRRFYHVIANVNDADTGKPKQIAVGLVGMHIAMRTKSSPEWIWATFEHVDNAPELVDNPKYPDGHPAFDEPLKSHYNFFDPHLGGSLALNHLADKNAVTDSQQRAVPSPPGDKPTTWSEKLTTTPVQVVRLVPAPGQDLEPRDAELRSDVAALNAQVQACLGAEGSVFQYYKLIGTQWPIHPGSPATPGGQGSAPDSIVHKTPGDMVPIYLANTTMETYFQHGVQNAGALEQDDRLMDNSTADTTRVFGTESCVGCHYSAGIVVRFAADKHGRYLRDANGDKIPEYGINGNFGHDGNAEFSWLLEIEAKSKEKPVLPEKSAAGSPRS